MQGEGSSYLYFGHVGQLLLGEELARQGVEPALDYILRFTWGRGWRNTACPSTCSPAFEAKGVR